MVEPRRDAPYDEITRVVAMVPDMVKRRDVHRALPDCSVSYCADVPEARCELERTGARMLVAQLHATTNGRLVGLLDVIQREAPAMMVAVTGELDEFVGAEHAAIARHMLVERVLYGAGFSEHLSLMAGAANPGFARGSFAERVRREVGGRVGDVMAFMIERADQPLRCAQVSERFEVDESTVLRWLKRRGTTMEASIGHARAVAAGVLLGGSLMSVEDVALMLGFGGQPALTNHMRRYARGSPTAMRRTGAVHDLVARIIEDLSRRLENAG